ncbi:chorismate mutase [Helicobacter felistomachi]|uniref:chorismate mutase n=1 Tax=Helicobacter felistomachi TaxID=3040201 RepID=UPI002573AF67|nr:chorismate mutase [Helicobacter sp. NHP21005]
MGHLKGEGIASKRVQIDQIDQSLVKLLNERFALSTQIAKDKHQIGLSVYNPLREAEIFAKVGGRLESVYTEILGVSRGLIDPEKVGVSGSTNTARRLLGQKFKLNLFNPLKLFDSILLKGVDYGLLEVRKTCAYAEGLKVLVGHVARQDLEIAHSFKIGRAWCLLIGRFGFLAQTNPTRKALWFEPAQAQEVQTLLNSSMNPYFAATKFGCLLEVDMALELPAHLQPVVLGTYSNTRRACGV